MLYLRGMPMTPAKWVFRSWFLRVAVVLAFLGMILGAVSMYVHAVRKLTPKPAAPLTPLSELFITGPEPDKRISDAAAYRLRIYGKVGKEVSLTLDDVKALPVHETDDPVICVLDKVGHVLWRGARIADVIEAAGPDPEATTLVFHDDRNFSASLSLDYVRSGQPLLAWSANGQELPRVHGWPLRVVAPGKWGFKWVKWVTAIELTDRGYEGTYERMGFSLNGNRDEPKLEADKHLNP
jgi:DMSO/TMAO reductase YedYZ molybdopterin-dependent catalytic subunit